MDQEDRVQARSLTDADLRPVLPSREAVTRHTPAQVRPGERPQHQAENENLANPQFGFQLPPRRGQLAANPSRLDPAQPSFCNPAKPSWKSREVWPMQMNANQMPVINLTLTPPTAP